MTIRTIGATGRDYSTISAWEAATDNDLVTASSTEIGEMYDDADFSEAVTFTGATTNASYYRELKAASGEEFDPVANTGVVDVITNSIHVLVPFEGYFRIGGQFGLFFTNSATSQMAAIRIRNNGDNVLVYRMFIYTTDQNGPYSVGIQQDSGADSLSIQNCNVTTDNTGGFVGNYGITISESNCSIYNTNTYNFTQNGIWYTGASSGHKLNNNISINSGGADFNFGTVTFTSNDYNGSSDSTATGSNSINSLVSADTWTDPANNDFTLKAGSQAIAQGTDLSGTFTDDYAGTTRSGTWDMGAYNALVAAAGITQYLIMVT